MEIFRIVLAKWADKLTASGRAARWNSDDHFVIYTASSRALACLENVVHRSGRGLQGNFRTMVISVPDGLPIATILPDELPDNWRDFDRYTNCQRIGDSWLSRAETAVLRVPSAIVPMEYNYLINAQHPDFHLIDLKAIEPFDFDNRIKTD